MTHPRPRPSAGSAAYGETGTPLSGQINDFRVRGVLLNRCDALLGAVDEMVVMGGHNLGPVTVLGAELR